jgi:hypothetical protein
MLNVFLFKNQILKNQTEAYNNIIYFIINDSYIFIFPIKLKEGKTYNSYPFNLLKAL